MGSLDSFFKAFEQQWFWPLLDALKISLDDRLPDRPGPIDRNPETPAPPKGLAHTDMLFEFESLTRAVAHDYQPTVGGQYVGRADGGVSVADTAAGRMGQVTVTAHRSCIFGISRRYCRLPCAVPGA